MISGSKEELLNLIKRQGTLSIDEASRETNLAKTTLREHFLQLERDGYISRDYVRSGPGRPSLRYQLTNKGHAIYPSHESKLLKEFLRYLKKTGEESKIEKFFELFWQKRLSKARQTLEELQQDEQGVEMKLKAVSGMLEDEGFMPVCDMVDSKGKEPQVHSLRECNCPFREVIEVTRLPCELEEAFYKKLFGNKVERVAYIPEGDYSCTYKIPAK